MAGYMGEVSVAGYMGSYISVAGYMGNYISVAGYMGV